MPLRSLSLASCLLFAMVATAQNVPRSSHVWMITEENSSYDSIVGSAEMPYFNQLIQQYGLATQFYSDQHSSLPALMWLVAGAPVELNNDTVSCNHPQDNIVRELLNQGYTCPHRHSARLGRQLQHPPHLKRLLSRAIAELQRTRKRKIMKEFVADFRVGSNTGTCTPQSRMGVGRPSDGGQLVRRYPAVWMSRGLLEGGRLGEDGGVIRHNAVSRGTPLFAGGISGHVFD